MVVGKLVIEREKVVWEYTASIASVMWMERTACSRVGEDESASNANSNTHAHNRRETTLADERRRDLLPVEHQGGREGADGSSRSPVRWPRIPEYARDVPGLVNMRRGLRCSEAYGSLSMSCLAY